MHSAAYFTLACVAALGLGLSACSSLAPRTTYTSAESSAADVPGLGAVRLYADGPAYVFDRFRRDVYAQAAARHEPVTFLALSAEGPTVPSGPGFLRACPRHIDGLSSRSFQV